ncbi:MAG: serine O-acetyltransferase [Desulfotalea sp.]|nr:MAG: serine O-acetyltransferase [Desulfotalea sp.]
MICQSFSECFFIDTHRIVLERSVWKIFKLCFRESRILAVVLFRISQYMWSKKMIWRFAPYIKRINEVLTGFECHLEANIDSGLLLAHTQNIVIGQGVKIGKQVTIYNGVTLGAVRTNTTKNADNRYPKVMDRVVIYSGAKIIGNIVVGVDSVVGANAVVLQNIPSNCVAVGVPARLIGR